MQNKNRSFTFVLALLPAFFSLISAATSRLFTDQQIQSAYVFEESARNYISQGQNRETIFTNNNAAIESYQRALLEYEKALNIWKKVDKGCNYIRIRTSIGILQYKTGQYVKALASYKESFNGKKKPEEEKNSLPQYVQRFHEVGMALLDKGEYQLAIEAYEYCLEAAEAILTYNKGASNYITYTLALNNMGNIYENQAECYESQGELGKKEQALGKALYFYQLAYRIQQSNEGICNSEKAKTINNIGDIYKAQKKDELALKHYQICFSLLSQSTDDHLGEAIQHEKKKEIKEAIDSYKNLLKEYKNTLGGKVSYANALSELFSDVQMRILELVAKKHYQKGFELENQGLQICNEGLELSKKKKESGMMNKYKEAIQTWKEAIHKYENYHHIYKVTLQNEKKRKKRTLLQEARLKALEKACEKTFQKVSKGIRNCQINMAVTYYYEGVGLEMQGKIKEAMSKYKEARKIYQAFTITDFRLDNVAMALEIEKGEKLYSRADEVGDEGNKEKNKGHYNSAIKKYKKAIKKYKRLIKIYKEGKQRIGQQNNISNLYQKVIKLCNTNQGAITFNYATILEAKGKLLEAQKKYEEAIECFKKGLLSETKTSLLRAQQATRECKENMNLQ